MLRITNVISNIDRAVSFEWLVDGLAADKYKLDFILLNPKEPSYLQDFLRNRGVPVRTILLRSRCDYPRVFLTLLWHFLSTRPDIVHTHLLDASLLALPAAWFAGIGKRVVTRHHSTFHHKFAPRWVKVDRFISWLATRIIAVSLNVKNVLVSLERVRPEKITLIHNSFDFSSFENISDDRVDALRKKYALKDTGPVIGVISRFIRWKGIQYILPAFQRLLETQPHAILVLANADGPDAEWVRSLLSKFQKSVRTIEFEKDIFALYKLFDVFVHVPVDSQCEAHGQVYVEALAAGVPSVFTLSGVAPEFVVDRKNALVVDFQNPDQIFQAVMKILNGEVAGKLLSEQGKESIQQFHFSHMLKKLETEYTRE